MKKLLKKLFALLGFKIYRIKKNTVNKDAEKAVSFRDAFQMQKYIIDDIDQELIIFDIGAYDGRTALEYKKLFPKSKIFSFEPFPDSYSKLVENISPFKNIIAVNKGVAAKEGTSMFNSNSFAPTNSLLDTHESGSVFWGAGLLDTVEKVNVELTTIDSLVETYNLKKIDILKMDVQGAEYLVMEGAKKSIERGIIHIIYTEIMTLQTYKEQLNFDEMVKLMRTNGFTLFNLYNSSLTNKGQLRNVDALFLKTTQTTKLKLR